MNLEKARKPLTVLAVLVSATGLALLVDGRKVLIEICVVALALTVFFVWAWIRAYQNFWKIQRVMAAFFLWSATSAVFAFRMLHLESLYLIIFLGALVAIFVGLLWSPVRFLGALITFEWFVIFLFAPASYAVLGALTTTFSIATMCMFDATNTRRDIIKQLIGAALVGAIFILAFKWML